MHHFIVCVWFVFHGVHGQVRFPIDARDAERATHMGFKAGRDLGCLYNAHVTHCVGPTSVGVRVREIN
jgi:hypothetical protein